ncbi:MAG: hypothetical protein HQL74_07000 [Magnetococcales bacterium]|nr:hypothetical protein [Magnetococcales bacterium]
MQVSAYPPIVRVAHHTPGWGPFAAPVAGEQSSKANTFDSRRDNSFEQLLGHIERQLDKRLDRGASL